MAPNQSTQSTSNPHPPVPAGTAASNAEVWDPTADAHFPEAKKRAIEHFYPKYGIKAVVMKGHVNSHHKMAGYAGMATGGDLTSFCSKDYSNNGPLRQACNLFQSGSSALEDHLLNGMPKDFLHTSSNSTTLLHSPRAMIVRTKS